MQNLTRSRQKLAPFDEVVEKISLGYKACCFDSSCTPVALFVILEIVLLLKIGQFEPLASTGESPMGEAFADSGASYAKEVFQMPRITPALVKTKEIKIA